jgi:hypothetical protein
MKYVILNSSETPSIDFNQVQETSLSTLRFSADESKTFVKFVGSTPEFLEGKTQYTHSQILSILGTTEWSRPLVP